MATALSEVSRRLLAASAAATSPSRLTAPGRSLQAGGHRRRRRRRASATAAGSRRPRRLMDRSDVATGRPTGDAVVTRRHAVARRRAARRRPLDGRCAQRWPARVAASAARRAARPRTASWSPRWTRCRPSATTLAPVNAELEETNRGVLALYGELSERAGDDQPGRRRALRRDRRQEPRSCARPARPRPGSCANVSHELRTPVNSVLGPGPAAARPGGRPAHRRAAPPDRAHRRQRARTCSGWSTSCSTSPRPSPAASSRPWQPVDLGDAVRRAARDERPAGRPDRA